MSSRPRIENFRYLTPLWAYRAKDRSLLLPRGVDPKVIVGADYSVKFYLNGIERTVKVRKGLVTDLASSPWLARSIVGRVGRHLEAAIVHDWLYGNPETESRAYADAVFLAGMAAAKVNRGLRWAIYLSVRAFGERAYGRENRFAAVSPYPTTQPKKGRPLDG